ncbi:tubulin polyglutamylase TTLL13-like isoform X2 [Athalia rosae]|uniref:tubulin polyglutamylase TTLL13-like isoform X2 n=1 Tax=Athalia rosae TaxID=37344 RepID=UPI0020344976|nr:tubulin polyglutamylase TTLL13-like isoform X2 [Athalia rosae]
MNIITGGGNDKRPLVVLRNVKEYGEVAREDSVDSGDGGNSCSVGEVKSLKTTSDSSYKRLLLSNDASKSTKLDGKHESNTPKNSITLLNPGRKSISISEMIKEDSVALQPETSLDSKKMEQNRPPKSVKKKKRRFLTICTSNCKYEVVRRVAAKFGMKEVTEDSSWNLYWTDLSISIERAKDMKRFQKVNHFPGMTEICRKDLLARNLNRMLRLFPKDYNFFPKTWCLPADHGEAIAYAKLRKAKTFIVKPDTGCQGRGIYLTKNLKDVKPYDRMICQVYVSRPFLVDGFKFDLRVYTLITSCDPLRIYIYNDGLARFATSRYKEPTGHNTSNVFMHLTNYAVNKHSRMYIIDDEAGSKRKISTLNKWLKMKDVDVEELWSKIDDVIIKTILAAYPILKHSYHTCFPTHDMTYACFELLGFDVLLDWKLKPYLLEVNHSPSFHTDAQIDKDIKESLLSDTFEILNFQQCDKRKIMEEDRKRVRERLLQGINFKESSMNDGATGFAKFDDKPEADPISKQHKWEDEHLGNFRRVYPGPGTEKYNQFFKQGGSSMFQDTAASRAREEASKLHREETELKIKEQESKRMVGKWSDHKVRPESPLTHKKSHATIVNQEKSKTKFAAKKMSPPILKKSVASSLTTNILYSFEPEIISESEERDRITALAQRDFLIKSYGILEQIYVSMKKNGTLRLEDERKYGMYGKLGYVNEVSSNGVHKSYHSYQNLSFQKNSKLHSATNQSAEYILKYHQADGRKRYKNGDKCLKIMCNEAPVYMRPDIPPKFWVDELNSNERDARITKTHVARTLSNTLRLHALEKRETSNPSNVKIE